MEATITTSASETELTISIRGRFDFSAQRNFRHAYETIENCPTTFLINMNETTYVDSSALGMLLILREHAGGDEAKITLINCNEDIKKNLQITNFGKLFKIH